MNNSVDSLWSTLRKNSPWLAITGAGVSAASGIPTYRDHEGRWLGSQPIQHREFVEDITKRKTYWSRSILGWPMVERALPNMTHKAMVDLEQAGVVTGIITQNVDRLHQKAGSQNVIDLHGRLDRVICHDCSVNLCRKDIQFWLENNNPTLNTKPTNILPDGDVTTSKTVTSNFRIPSCPDCNGILMPAVVFFGGHVPRQRVLDCHESIDKCAGILVVGSSLSVYSGYRLCRYAVDQGKPLVILNKGKTRADALSTRKYNCDPFSMLMAVTNEITPGRWNS